MRIAAFRNVLVLGLALHIHHHFRGPPIDYVGLVLASGASWVGVPGPGEPLLIAAGVFAARGRLDLGSVLLVAWAGATVGGMIGWVIGMIAGRRLLTAPGPLHRTRLNAVARGDEIFKRVPVIAIILAPSWISGIHRVRTALYLPVNALSAAIWACFIGLGAYFVGPTVIDLVDDVGWVMGGGLALLVLSAVLLEVRRRRRRRARAQSPVPAQETG